MKTYKKIIKAFDLRQKQHNLIVARLDAKKRMGYKKPGSMNPRKNGA